MFKRFNRVDLGDGQEVIKKLNAYLPGIEREEMGSLILIFLDLPL